MTMDDNDVKRAYEVNGIEVVMKTDEVLARVFTFVPGDTIPWHDHRLSSDPYFVLSGALIITTEHPTEKVVVESGGRWRVDPGTHHDVSNASDTVTSFLLLQGTGGYDWIKVDR